MTKIPHKRNKKETKKKIIVNKITIEKEWLIKLNEGLPHGSFTIIHDRIIEKYGIEEKLSTAYIRLVLHPDDPRTNPKVLDEAIAYRDEVAAWQAALKARIYRS